MPRLPIPGSDEGNWGQILNDYLSQTHSSDGQLKPGVITSSNLSQDIQDKIDIVAGQQGPTGATGPQGSTGATGAQGASGVAGVSGATGATGPSGATGSASTIPGPTGPQGPSGAAGPSGASGAQGASGTPGLQGAAGPQGPSGATGPSGASGAMGPTGPKGDDGQDGTSVTITGSVASAANLPTNLGGGDAGKGYLTNDDGHLHVWSGTGFTDVGVIRGPSGPQGATGPVGATGPSGPSGASGASGPSGASGAVGATGPVGATGAASTVAGPTGPSGPVGATGPTGPGSTVYPLATQGGTSYTLQLADAGSLISFTNSAAVTVTVPTAATAAFAVGARIKLVQQGTGQVTIVPANGVTIQAATGFTIADQYRDVELVKTGASTWLLTGWLAVGEEPTGPTEPTDNPNTVSIGSATYALAGTNTARGTSEIIRYTRSSEQTATPTNQYGVEVVVNSTTNQVVSVNDRINSGSETGTPIPDGHYVLSGHGQGSGYAGQWLRDNATVGATIQLSTVSVDITGFTAAAASSTSIDMSWNYSGAALTNFTLRRNNTVIASPAAGARTYTDTGLNAGTNYTYTITANYQAGGASNTASASTSTQGSAPSGSTIIAMWHHTWAGPALRNYPADVKANINHYSLGMAQSSQSGTGYVSYSSANGQSNADHATDIRALVASGKSVVVGIGGAGSGGVSVTNSTQAQQLVSSVQSMVNTFGINGIDIDLEAGSSSWTATALREACLSLKSIYGNSFVIGVTTQMYGQYTAQWMNFLNTLGHNNYDYTGPMLYDFPESRKSSTLIPVCLDKVNTMVSNGVPQSKILLGFMLQPAGQPNYSASESAQVIRDSYSATKAQYPNINGVFFWADDIDSGRSWEFSRQVAPYI